MDLSFSLPIRCDIGTSSKSMQCGCHSGLLATLVRCNLPSFHGQRSSRGGDYIISCSAIQAKAVRAGAFVPGNRIIMALCRAAFLLEVLHCISSEVILTHTGRKVFVVYSFRKCISPLNQRFYDAYPHLLWPKCSPFPRFRT